MKKKIGLITAIIIGAAVLGAGIYQSDAVHGDPDLSQDEIREIVKSQYPGGITQVTLESDNMQTAVYEVQLEYDRKGYLLKIDGNTGQVLEMQEVELQEASREEDSGDTDSSGEEHADKQTQEETGEKQDEQEEDDKEPLRERSTIDSEEARRIALNEFDGTVTSLELDEEDDRLIYEIEIERGEEEAEIVMDAVTGEVVVICVDRYD